MRLSAFILNCLMLIMIFAPCRDHWNIAPGTSHVRVVYASSPHEDGQTGDNCSPLCSSCSFVSARIHIPYVILTLPQPAAKKFPAYNTPEYSTERSSIWQPPRIG